MNPITFRIGGYEATITFRELHPIALGWKEVGGSILADNHHGVEANALFSTVFALSGYLAKALTSRDKHWPLVGWRMAAMEVLRTRPGWTVDEVAKVFHHDRGSVCHAAKRVQNAHADPRLKAIVEQLRTALSKNSEVEPEI